MSNGLTCVHNFRKNFHPITFFFALCFLVYASSFVRCGFIADDIADFNNDKELFYIAQQRWGLALFRTLVGASALHWATGITACIFISLSIWIQCKVLNIYRFSEQVLYGSCYIAVPQFSYVLLFSMLSDAVACGIFSASLAVWFLVKENQKCYDSLLAILFITFSISCYQSIGLYYLVLVTTWYISKILRKENASFKRYIYIVSLSLPALILYFCVNKIFISLSAPPAEYIDFTLQYREACINGLNFASYSPILKFFYIAHCTKDIILNLINFNSFSWFYNLSIIPCFYTIIGLLRYKENNLFIRILHATLVVCILIGAYAIIYLYGNKNYGGQCLLALPVSCAGLWLLATRMGLFSRNKVVLYVVVFFACLRTMYYNNNFNDKIRNLYEKNIIQAYLIINEAERVAAKNNINLHESGVAVAAKRYTILNYLHNHPSLGVLIPAGEKEYKNHGTVFKQMPAWPHEGSVRVNKGQIIVNAPNFSFLELPDGY